MLLPESEVDTRTYEHVEVGEKELEVGVRKLSVSMRFRSTSKLEVEVNMMQVPVADDSGESCAVVPVAGTRLRTH